MSVLGKPFQPTVIQHSSILGTIVCYEENECCEYSPRIPSKSKMTESLPIIKSEVSMEDLVVENPSVGIMSLGIKSPCQLLPIVFAVSSGE